MVQDAQYLSVSVKYAHTCFFRRVCITNIRCLHDDFVRTTFSCDIYVCVGVFREIFFPTLAQCIYCWKSGGLLLYRQSTMPTTQWIEVMSENNNAIANTRH